MAAYRSKMMLSLGSVISAFVDIHTVIPTQKTGAHLLCGTHTKRLSQFYRCEEGEEVPRENQVRGIETGNGWLIQTNERPLVETDKQIQLTPVPMDEVLENTFEGDSIYYLVPSASTSNQVWQVLASIVRKNEIAMISKCALGSRQNEKMWKLGLFRGYLVLRELVYPEAIKATPEIPDATIDKQTAALVDQFVENLVSSWDSFDTSDPNLKRLDAWMQAGKLIEDPDVQVKEVSAVPLLDSLREAVEENKKRAKIRKKVS